MSMLLDAEAFVGFVESMVERTIHPLLAARTVGGMIDSFFSVVLSQENRFLTP